MGCLPHVKHNAFLYWWAGCLPRLCVWPKPLLLYADLDTWRTVFWGWGYYIIYIYIILYPDQAKAKTIGIRNTFCRSSFAKICNMCSNLINKFWGENQIVSRWLMGYLVKSVPSFFLYFRPFPSIWLKFTSQIMNVPCSLQRNSP